MRDAPRATLLDFAVVASVAVVPLLIVVLLALDRIAPSAHAGRAGERHVSVRQVAAFTTFEHAIVRRAAVERRAIDEASLVAAVPACEAEWTGRGRLVDRARAAVGLARDDARAPAARIARSLATLDRALARLGAPGNRRVTDPVGFDLGRWGKAATAALSTPLATTQYPGRRFDVRCADLASAAIALARDDGRMLAALAWRGTEVARTTAAWRDDQVMAISPRWLARANPWSGIPGCTYVWADGGPTLFVAGPRTAMARVCGRRELFAATGSEAAPRTVGAAGEPVRDMRADDARWSVPPGLAPLLQSLEPLQRPSGALHRSIADGAGNRVRLDGASVDVGFSLDLTIDATLQAIAQKTAGCYTGRHDLCDALAMRRADDEGRAIGDGHLERAMVRMAAIAIVDVKSGRIEALAGALSPCTREEHDGPGRSAHCDARLPYPVRYRPDALANAAVHHDAMPASIVKPIMATAFLSSGAAGARWLAAERHAMRSTSAPAANSLRGQLARSDSARFLDRMFCSDSGYVACGRIWEVQALAAAFGWNAGCAGASERCGRRDVLFGRGDANADADGGRDAPATFVSYGRLLVEPSPQASSAFHLRKPLALDTARVARCALGADGRRATPDDWEKCRGGAVVDVVAEGWGQGHARASALGAAGMMMVLAGTANGQQAIRAPHLVRAIRAVADVPAVDERLARLVVAPTESNPLSREAAEVVMSGLAWSHRQGTARRACEQVFDARACRDIAWIAGKTGTPTFPNDARSLDDIRTLCASTAKRTRDEQAACGALRPYKWYVAAYRMPGDAGWSKAIAVLTERNFIAATGRIHGAGDHGPNPAAEIAFQVAGRHVGALNAEPR
jgi:hypothetical protein